MEQNEITEGNKLIAEFMGEVNEISDIFYLPQHGHYFNSYGQIEWNDCFRTNELKYYSSWDWLMPVVEKIEKTKHMVDICEDMCSIDTRIDEFGTTKIEATWLAVVEFIKWYNNETL